MQKDGRIDPSACPLHFPEMHGLNCGNGDRAHVIRVPKLESRMMRYELGDYEWTAIKPTRPNKPRNVRRVNDRRVLNGIFGVIWSIKRRKRRIRIANTLTAAFRMRCHRRWRENSWSHKLRTVSGEGPRLLRTSDAFLDWRNCGSSDSSGLRSRTFGLRRMSWLMRPAILLPDGSLTCPTGESPISL
jgi:hypothetical protein